MKLYEPYVYFKWSLIMVLASMIPSEALSSGAMALLAFGIVLEIINRNTAPSSNGKSADSESVN
jgi:hypothetical protein